MMAGIPAAVDGASSDFLKSIEFHMYAFKILSCPLKTSHSWSDCPWAHPKEQARRRDPRRWYYLPVMCPYAKQGAFACPRGDSCDMAHQVYELWLHPAKFRTELCRKGPLCDRRLCFFAHRPDELRSPTEEGLIASGAMAPRPTSAQSGGGGPAQPCGNIGAASAAAMMALVGPLDDGSGGDALALNAAMALHPTSYATASSRPNQHHHVGGLVAPHGISVPTGGWEEEEAAMAVAAAAAGAGSALLAPPNGGFTSAVDALGTLGQGTGPLYTVPATSAVSHHHRHMQILPPPQPASSLIVLQSMGYDASGPAPFAHQLHHPLQRGTSLDTAGSAPSSVVLPQLPANTVVAPTGGPYSTAHNTATSDSQLQQHLAQLHHHHQATAQLQAQLHMQQGKLLQLGSASSPVTTARTWTSPHLMHSQGVHTSPPHSSDHGNGAILAPRSPPTTAALQPRQVLVIGAPPGGSEASSSAAGDLDTIYSAPDPTLRRSVGVSGSAPLPPSSQVPLIQTIVAPVAGGFEPASISAPLSVLSRGNSGTTGEDAVDGGADASAACGNLQLRALALRLQELTDAAAAAEAAGFGAPEDGNSASSTAAAESGRLRMVRALASALKDELSGLTGTNPEINSDETLAI